MRVVWTGRTVVGQVRTNNEDNLVAAPVGKSADIGDSDGQSGLVAPGMILAVADGMGGALAGEVASRLAVETLVERLSSRGPTIEADDADGHRAALVEAVEEANQRIRAEGEQNSQYRGMGTTITAVWAHGNVAEIAQVGDSRAYLFRGGHLKQLTKDQSLVGKLIEDGIITEDEAERIAGRNIILQALGSEEELEVVHQTEELQPGDMLLLCTDGLCGVVMNPETEQHLRLGGDTDELARRLIQAAEDRGGPDNITVIIAHVNR